MALRHRVRFTRRLAAGSAIAVAVFALLFGALPAFAEEAEVQIGEDMIIIDLSQPVVKDTCSQCHGSIAETDNYAGEIEFKHGYHQLIQCAGCHSRFPHRPEATIETPTMEDCFACHGVRHGPMGLVASDECEDCHTTRKERLRPEFHEWDWKGEPHVQPAVDNFNTQCAMCHDQASCDECHAEEGVSWAPASWEYDPGDGCLACHGSEFLQKASEGGPRSFFVSGVEDSAHADVTCQECHIDYRYDDQAAPTEVWQVNVGLACAECHAQAEEEVDRLPVDLWEQSVHYEKLEEGDMESATCASCHGGHFIRRLDTDYDKEILHGQAVSMCAKCHVDEYASYDDYYHGAAYKAGAPDAPACWDCHKAHDVMPSSDASSSVSAENVSDTCGDCHSGSDLNFGSEAGELIHQKVEAVEANPLNRFIQRVRSWFT